jgi:hypothetical protein
MEIHGAKGPVNAKGEITLSNKGWMLVISSASMTLSELKKGKDTQPGYYAVRIVQNLGPTIKLTSNWVIVKIE